MTFLAASDPILLTMISPNQAEIDWVCQLCAKTSATLGFSSANTVEAAGGTAGNVFLLDLDALKLPTETDHLRVIDELARRGAVIVIAGKADAETEQSYLENGAVDVMQRQDLTPNGLRRALRSVVNRRHSERHLSRLKMRDAATGLATPPLFWEFLGLAERRARRNQDFFAVLLIDIAPIPQPDQGLLSLDDEDALMRVLAGRLQQIMRASDTLARFERRQFAILAEAMPRIEDVQIVAEKIVSELTKPIDADKGSQTVLVAVGIALYPTSATQAEGLVDRATGALQQVISRGHNDFAFG
ncbi:MAG: GGDEF domain-containing protein [Rhodospirillaceae bacterium]|nr:MAG: GGDEF domain-containing protein [Rhodospirillaceae bacterium]